MREVGKPKDHDKFGLPLLSRPSEFDRLLTVRQPTSDQDAGANKQTKGTEAAQPELPKLVLADKETPLEKRVNELKSYGIRLTYESVGGGKYQFTLTQKDGSGTVEFPLKARTLEELAKFTDPIISVAKKLKEAKEDYGIDIRSFAEANGKFRFTRHSKDGTSNLRAKTPEELERFLNPLLATAKKELEKTKKIEAVKAKARDALLEKLEKTFTISISKDGEKTKYREKEVSCRAPTLEELEALKTALYRAQPSHLLKNKKPLRIEFITDTVVKDAVAFRDPDRIVVQPSIKRERTTHNDAVPYLGPGSRGNTAVATFMHELAHNTQGRLDPDFDTKGSAASPEQAKLGERLGFRKLVDEKSAETTWLLEARTKSDGKNPDLFKKLPGEDGMWVRCDAKGKIVEEETGGKKRPVERLANEDMRKRAKFNLPTSYNTNPTETIAESLTCLRLGGASLTKLIKDCPEAYALAKELDRKDIIKTYGYMEGSKTEPAYIRNEKGLLVRNPEEKKK